jgi:allantoinase
MFYGDYGLHGKADRRDQRNFLMLGEDESYNLAHFEFVMRGAARVRARHPRLADHVSVSLHCEIADILNAYTRLVQQDPSLTGLRAYSAARPPHSEGLGVWIAAYLAHETGCRNVNLLHLSSRTALEAAFRMRATLPHLDFRCEVTAGHLLLDYDTPAGARAKVNPPIRSREDVEFLWQAVLDGKVDWVVSDHACCATETKLSADQPEDVWLAKAGFGGTVYLLSGVFSGGRDAGSPPPAWRSSCPGTRRGGTASPARVTSPRATTPTLPCSIPPAPSRCGPPIRRRRRGTRPSRASRSGGRS